MPGVLFRSVPAALLGAALVLGVSLSGQTKVSPPKNKFPVTEDVRLGKEAAAEVRTTMPLLQDAAVAKYLSALGKRLVAAVPPQYRVPEFTYTFEVVNQGDINAFALPGGPMFVNRGMMEKVSAEGGVAGVMAHELSHVLLRHGTAQITKAQRFQIGAIAGQVLGAVVGGATGGLIAQGSEFGLGTYLLKYSREYEKQADLLGVQILARAGWQPREMAEVFKAIEKEGGAAGPQWMSSHPNPGNRYEYLLKEGQSLTVAPGATPRDFESVRARLASMPPAYTAQQVAQMQKQGGPKNAPAPGGSAPPPATRTVTVPAPAATARTVNAAGVQVAVPANWPLQTALSEATFAPDGAVFTTNGSVAFTHGVQLGFVRPSTPRLEVEHAAFIKGLSAGNPAVSWNGAATDTTAGGRPARVSTLGNVSEVTGNREQLRVVTALSADGRLFYLIGVWPESEVAIYGQNFDKLLKSLLLPR